VLIASPGATAGEPSYLDTAAYRRLIAEFAATGRAVIAQLLATHVDDGTGHCTVCPGGPQAGHATFPCRLRELAEEAHRLGPDGPRWPT
jgi:hypothetical protein